MSTAHSAGRSSAAPFRPVLKSGTPKFAERFAVSRSPVRDALLRLEAEGLVVISPRKGYRAAPISIADARDLFELRAVLEPVCAASVASEASEEALRRLDRFRSMSGFAAAEHD